MAKQLFIEPSWTPPVDLLHMLKFAVFTQTTCFCRAMVIMYFTLDLPLEV